MTGKESSLFLTTVSGRALPVMSSLQAPLRASPGGAHSGGVSAGAAGRGRNPGPAMGEADGVWALGNTGGTPEGPVPSLTQCACACVCVPVCVRGWSPVSHVGPLVILCLGRKWLPNSLSPPESRVLSKGPGANALPGTPGLPGPASRDRGGALLRECGEGPAAPGEDPGRGCGGQSGCVLGRRAWARPGPRHARAAGGAAPGPKPLSASASTTPAAWGGPSLPGRPGVTAVSLEGLSAMQTQRRAPSLPGRVPQEVPRGARQVDTNGRDTPRRPESFFTLYCVKINLTIHVVSARK